MERTPHPSVASVTLKVLLSMIGPDLPGVRISFVKRKFRSIRYGNKQLRSYFRNFHQIPERFVRHPLEKVTDEPLRCRRQARAASCQQVERADKPKIGDFPKDNVPAFE